MKGSPALFRRNLKRTLLVGLLLLPILAATFYSSKTIVQAYHKSEPHLYPTESKTRLHMYPSNMTNQRCLACHDGQWVQSSPAMGMGEPTISAHKRHAFSVFLRFSRAPDDGLPNKGGDDSNTKGCVLCHDVTALGYEGDPSYTTSGFNVTAVTTSAIQRDPDPVIALSDKTIARKSVNPAVCVHCHGRWPRYAGSEHCGSGTLPCDPWRDIARLDPRGCVARCHGPDGLGGDVAEAHAQTTAAPYLDWIDERYANDGNYCLLCHGGYAWYEVFEWNPGDLHCLGCHKYCTDPDNMECGRAHNSPWGNNPLPPDINSLLKSTSAHPVGTQMRCTSCHGVRRCHRNGYLNHFGTSVSENPAQKLAKCQEPDDPNRLNFEINEGQMCGDCHASGGNETALAKYGDITGTVWATTRHATFLTDGISGYSNKYTKETKLICVRCHNPHGSDKGRLLGRPVWKTVTALPRPSPDPCDAFGGPPADEVLHVWPSGAGESLCGKKIELTTQSYVKSAEVATLVLHAPNQAGYVPGQSPSGCTAPGSPAGCRAKDPADVWCHYETYTFNTVYGTYPTVACTPAGLTQAIEDPVTTPRTWGKAICFTCHYKRWAGLVAGDGEFGEGYATFYYRWAGSDAFNGVVGGVPGNTARNAHLKIPANPDQGWVQAACLNCHNPHGTAQGPGEAQPGQPRYKYLVRQFDMPRKTSFQRRQFSLCMPAAGDPQSPGQPLPSGCHAPQNVVGHLKMTSSFSNPSTPLFGPPTEVIPTFTMEWSQYWGAAYVGVNGGDAQYTDNVEGCNAGSEWPAKRVCYDAIYPLPFGTPNPERYMTNFRNVVTSGVNFPSFPASPAARGEGANRKQNIHWEHLGVTLSYLGPYWNCCGDTRPLVGGSAGLAANTYLGTSDPNDPLGTMDGLPTCVTCHIPHGSSSANPAQFRALTKEPLSISYGSNTFGSYGRANSSRFLPGDLPYGCSNACHAGGAPSNYPRVWYRNYMTVNLSP